MEKPSDPGSEHTHTHEHTRRARRSSTHLAAEEHPPLVRGRLRFYHLLYRAPHQPGAPRDHHNLHGDRRPGVVCCRASTLPLSLGPRARGGATTHVIDRARARLLCKQAGSEAGGKAMVLGSSERRVDGCY